MILSCTTAFSSSDRERIAGKLAGFATVLESTHLCVSRLLMWMGWYSYPYVPLEGRQTNGMKPYGLGHLPPSDWLELFKALSLSN